MHNYRSFIYDVFRDNRLGKILPRKGLFVWPLVALCVANGVALMGVTAKAQQLCDSSNSASYGERASETRRTVELSGLGVTVAIPENYRTMEMQSGAVRILHPADFEMLQCTARGGRGGHGFYSATIGLVGDDQTMNLREQATWLAGYSQNRDGSRTPIATQIIPYEKDKLSGYIVTSETGYSVSFLGAIAGRESLLEVSAGCDCEVDVEAVTELLFHITVTD
jgi:hypothetical protein